MTDKHCESVNECVNGELCAMLKNSAGLTLVGCSHFKPKQPMTNEEYIHSLDTEGLAGLLYEYRYDNATPQQRLWLYENEGYCKKCIAEWLKEKHTGGES